jgi:hemin uptake protein HemP
VPLTLSPLSSLNHSPSLASLAPRAGHSGSPAAAVDSTDLLKGEKNVAIHHNGLIYRLQATRLGKLILTK